jgi:hypothetical protein
MGKVKRVFTVAGAAAALALTGGTVGQLAVADVSSKAEAATQRFWTKVTCTYALNGTGYAWLETWVTVDYSWGEEFWLGKRDYSYIVRKDRAPQYDYMCRWWA